MADRWYETDDWMGIVQIVGVDERDLLLAAKVAVAAERRLLATQIRALSIDSGEKSDRYPYARWELTADEMRQAVLALLEADS